MNRWKTTRACSAAGNCVGVSLDSDGGVLMVNTKHPNGVVLKFSAEEWRAFIAGVKAGEFSIEALELDDDG